MTDVVVNTEDVIVTVPQPVIPPEAAPVNVGLVEIRQVTARGSMWFTGNGPPVDPGGQVNDLYLDVDTGDIYQWNGSAWIFQGTFAPTTLTPEEILAMLLTVDGQGSLLDADKLDDHDSTYFATQAAMDAANTKNAAQDATLTDHESRITNNTNGLTALTGVTNGQTADIDALEAALAAETTNRTNADTTLTTNLAAEATARTNADTALDAKITTEKNRNDAQDTLIASKIGEAPNDGKQYVRKSLAWSEVSVPPGTIVQDTAPASPAPNQMWMKSSTGVLYIWYADADSSQWIEISASPQATPMGALNGITSINGGPLAGFRNKIVNSQYLIVQSPQVTYAATLAANAQYVDYWKAGPGGCTLTAAGVITAGTLVQIIEANDMVPGATYCINWFGNAPCTINGVAKNKGDTYVHSSGNVTVSFGVGNVTQAQLEPGNVITPFEVRPLGVELAACKWRYECVLVHAGGYQGVGGVNMVGGFPYGQKRVVPTVSAPIVVTSTNVNSASFTNVTVGMGASYSIVGNPAGSATVMAIVYAQADARL